MEIKPVNFYLHVDYWLSIESGLARHRCVRVMDDGPEDIERFVDRVLNAYPNGVVLTPASPAAIPPHIIDIVNYAVFKDFGDGVLNLIGWFDRKPTYWPGRVEQ